MKRVAVLLAIVFWFGVGAGHSQNPTVTKEFKDQPKAPEAKKQVAEPAKPATPSPPPAAAPSGKPITTEQQKALTDGIKLLQLDQIGTQAAKQTASQSDVLVQRAVEILNQALASVPEVKKATDREDTDRRALLAKIQELRGERGLDLTWDWDFNQNKFVKQQAPVPPAAVPAAPAK